MIANVKPQRSNPSADYLHAKFVELLPLIQKQASIAFCSERDERREELIAEVLADCWVAFVSLMERGLEDVVYATPLAQYAIKHVRSGRRVGGKLNVRDITSRHSQITTGVRVGRLDQCDDATDEWKEVVVEDRRAGPAAVASTRIDFAAWLKSLSHRNRRIATTLASGETGGATARRFNVSHGRISQIRRELKDSWNGFQGQAEGVAAVA
jgi:hypothetical protein